MRTLFARARSSLATIRGTLVWAAVGAALLTPAGALFGAPFGAVVAWRHHQASAFLPAMLRCTLSAAAAGAILGGFIRLADGHNPLVSTTPKPALTIAGQPPHSHRRRRAIPKPLLGRIGGHCLNDTWPRWEGGQQDPSMN